MPSARNRERTLLIALVERAREELVYELLGVIIAGRPAWQQILAAFGLGILFLLLIFALLAEGVQAQGICDAVGRHGNRLGAAVNLRDVLGDGSHAETVDDGAIRLRGVHQLLAELHGFLGTHVAPAEQHADRLHAGPRETVEILLLGCQPLRFLDDILVQQPRHCSPLLNMPY